MSDIGIYHPDQPEPSIPGWETTPSPSEGDQVVPEEIIHSEQSSGQGIALPPVILGCATFGYGIYTEKESVLSDMPVRVVRLALKSGITAFDTAPWYHPSEIILGNCLHTLRNEFPRESYQIITKVGKYGPRMKDHGYEPGVIRKSVERSLKRFKTDYLDVVYMHDVEFVSSPPYYPDGNSLDALIPSNREKYGLVAPFNSRGAGDENILAGLAELRQLQNEGKIKYVGFAGLPLPVLLRLALLVLHTPPYTPLDIIQTYANQTLQNPGLTGGYLKAFTEEAKVGLITNAAPLAMGTLTSGFGPSWHPGRTMLEPSVREAIQLCKGKGRSIEDVACDFGFERLTQRDGKVVPVVVGCKNVDEVHLNLRSYHRSNSEKRDRELEKEVQKVFEKTGVFGWCWESPPPESRKEQD